MKKRLCICLFLLGIVMTGSLNAEGPFADAESPSERPLPISHRVLRPSGKKNREQNAAQTDPEAYRFILEEVVPRKILSNISLLRSAMSVPRSLFVPKEMEESAYASFPIPIGSGQVLPPPFQTLFMLEQLEPEDSDCVCIFGGGTPYPAAVLSPLVSSITAFETLTPLFKKSPDLFKELDIQNVQFEGGKIESFQGKQETFNKILITGSADKIPDWLGDRLAEGGILLAAAGSPYDQKICRYRKESGKLTETPLLPAFPVPYLLGEDVPPGEPAAPLFQDSFEGESTLPLFHSGWFGVRNGTIQKDMTAPDGESVFWFDSQSVRRNQRRKDALKRQELTEGQTGSDSEPEAADLVLDELTLRQREEERITRGCRLFPLDGKRIRKVKISCQAEGIGIEPEWKYQRGVLIAFISFFDDEMNLLEGKPLIGIKRGNSSWQQLEQKGVAVPKRTSSALIQIGIFGGFGILKVDALTIEKD